MVADDQIIVSMCHRTCLSLDDGVETKVVFVCQRARLALVDEGGG